MQLFEALLHMQAPEKGCHGESSRGLAPAGVLVAGSSGRQIYGVGVAAARRVESGDNLESHQQ